MLYAPVRGSRAGRPAPRRATTRALAATTRHDPLYMAVRLWTGAEHLFVRAHVPRAGSRSIGHIGGITPFWMTPRSLKPCREYKSRLPGLVASR